MSDTDRERIVGHSLPAENLVDKRGNPLSPKPFVTLVPFVVRTSG
jgi:hypothetical protein